MAQIQTVRLYKWKARTPSEKLAVWLVRLLADAGFKQTYIVGGYVRDMLLKLKETGMIDLATEATPIQVLKVLKKRYRVIPTGLKHGTVTVHKGKDNIEITTFRKEGKYLDRRRPEKVDFIKSAKIDSSRRDFTVNSLYFNPVSRQVYDFQGGLLDLKKKVLKFVGSPIKRIEEDALRLMRAVRFSVILDFKLPVAEKKAIRTRAGLIAEIAPERIKQELDKIMLSQGRAQGIRLLHQLGLLKHILPEIEMLAKTGQSKNFHSEGNVFEHTMIALSLAESSIDLNALYGLLFHDAGKGVTARPVKKNGRKHVAFHGHQSAGEKLACQALNRLRFSNAEITDVCWYVRNHHVPFELRKMRKSKQIAWCLDPRFGELLKIFRADSLASIPTDSKGRQLKSNLDFYKYALNLLKKASTQKVLKEKFITGNDVMRILKIKEGPQVGRVLAELKEQQLSGKIKSRAEAIRHLKKIEKML